MNRIAVGVGLLLMIVLTSPTSFATQNIWTFPTAIPGAESQQNAIRNSLLDKPQQQRTVADWKQLALVSMEMISGNAYTDPLLFAQTEQLIQAARFAFPSDVELIAIEGTILCIKAGLPSLSGMQSMALVNQGFRQLDRAINLAPQHMGPRLQRAITAFHTPKFLGKTELAIADLKFLLSHIPLNSELFELRAMLLFLLGELWHQQAERTKALQAWQEAANLKVSGWSEKAARRLRE